jgi:hypothetical protein
VKFVLDGEVIPAFHRFEQRQVELAEAHIPEDPADFLHRRFIRGAGY